MIEGFMQNMKGLLIQPYDAFEKLKSSSLTDAYRHYVLLLIIFVVLFGAVSVASVFISFYDLLVQYATLPIIGSLIASKINLFRPVFTNWSIFTTYMMFLVLLFAIFIKGFFIHVFVILLGGKHGLTQTLQVLMYAVTPFFLIGWIPYISVIGLIWAVVLCIIGLMVLHDIPSWKAIAIIAIPTVLVIIGIISELILIASFVHAISGII